MLFFFLKLYLQKYIYYYLYMGFAISTSSVISTKILFKICCAENQITFITLKFQFLINIIYNEYKGVIAPRFDQKFGDIFLQYNQQHNILGYKFHESEANYKGSINLSNEQEWKQKTIKMINEFKEQKNKVYKSTHFTKQEMMLHTLTTINTPIATKMKEQLNTKHKQLEENHIASEQKTVRKIRFPPKKKSQVFSKIKIKNIKTIKKIDQQYSWGENINIVPYENFIQVQLVPQKQYQHVQYKNVVNCHFILYRKGFHNETPVIDMTCIRFINGYTLQFSPSKKITKQQYEYEFTFELKNQIIKVKKGTIIFSGEYGHQIDRKFIKMNNKIEQNIEQKLKQIEDNCFILNVLVIGRVGLGKSSYIKYCLRFFQQFYNFEYDSPPYTAESNRTVTVTFQKHELRKKGNNSRQFLINFIDSPGLGGQLKQQTFIKFSEIYYDALKLALNGQLNYSKFSITSNKEDVEKARITPDPKKLIHYCLIFIKPSEINQLKEVIQKVSDLIIQQNRIYGLVINRSDEILGDYLPSLQIVKQLKQLIKQQFYKVQGNDHLFVQSLSPQYFPQNQIFYNQFLRSIFFSLNSAFQQVSHKMINIYLKADQVDQDDRYIKTVNTKNETPLQDFVNQTKKVFKGKSLDKIFIKDGQYGFINLQDIVMHLKLPVQKSLVYYKFKVKNQWRIQFKIIQQE